MSCTLRILQTILVVLFFAEAALAQATADPNYHLDVAAFGAKADGKSGRHRRHPEGARCGGKQGGVVRLPAGKLSGGGKPQDPRGVALVGSTGAGLHRAADRHRDPGHRRTRQGGSPALFEMGDSSTVQGLTVFYPEQKPDDIHPYAWTFHLQGGDNTVENVTLINSYNGIRIGPEPTCAIAFAASTAACCAEASGWTPARDIGRIENVQWHCHWWSSPKVGGDWDQVYKYMWQNCEGFIFARTDWEYVTNTFIFPVNIGYHFIATKNGAMNGQLCGIGADAANRCIVVDEIQPMGLLITNGQFVAFEGENPIEIVINPTCSGSVRLQNCAFWGPAVQNVVSHSKSFVSLSNCYFSSGRPKNPGKAWSRRTAASSRCTDAASPRPSRRSCWARGSSTPSSPGTTACRA